jgi:Ca2+-binding EF-hand superfamily protein
LHQSLLNFSSRTGVKIVQDISKVNSSSSKIFYEDIGAGRTYDSDSDIELREQENLKYTLDTSDSEIPTPTWVESLITSIFNVYNAQLNLNEEGKIKLKQVLDSVFNTRQKHTFEECKNLLEERFKKVNIYKYSEEYSYTENQILSAQSALDFAQIQLRILNDLKEQGDTILTVDLLTKTVSKLTSQEEKKAVLKLFTLMARRNNSNIAINDLIEFIYKSASSGVDVVSKHVSHLEQLREAYLNLLLVESMSFIEPEIEKM